MTNFSNLCGKVSATVFEVKWHLHIVFIFFDKNTETKFDKFTFEFTFKTYPTGF